MLEAAVQPERDPPEMEISDSAKLVEASEREKVRLAVSPAFKEETSDVTAMVGLTVSTVRVSELLGSAPSVLVLPAASVNLADATDITPSVVLSAAGVKVAV